MELVDSLPSSQKPYNMLLTLSLQPKEIFIFLRPVEEEF